MSQEKADVQRENTGQIRHQAEVLCIFSSRSGLKVRLRVQTGIKLFAIDSLNMQPINNHTLKHTHTQTQRGSGPQDGHKQQHVRPNIAGILTVPLVLRDPRPSHSHVLTFWHNPAAPHCKGRSQLGKCVKAEIDCCF